MLKLLKLFIDFCLLRAKPYDVPASRSLLALTLIVYAVMSVALASVQLSLGKALLYALADIMVLALVTHTLLLLRRLPARLMQTLTALAGTGALFELLALPLARATEPSPLLFGLMIWSIAVSAHILRYALSVSFARGMLASVGYVVVNLIVMSALFPATL